MTIPTRVTIPRAKPAHAIIDTQRPLRSILRIATWTPLIAALWIGVPHALDAVQPQPMQARQPAAERPTFSSPHQEATKPADPRAHTQPASKSPSTLPRATKPQIVRPAARRPPRAGRVPTPARSRPMARPARRPASGETFRPTPPRAPVVRPQAPQPPKPVAPRPSRPQPAAPTPTPRPPDPMPQAPTPPAPKPPTPNPPSPPTSIAPMPSPPPVASGDPHDPSGNHNCDQVNETC